MIFESIVAAVCTSILGMVWYSKALFGKQWMRHSGIADEEINSGAAGGGIFTYIASFLFDVVTAIVLAFLFYHIGVVSLREGVMIASLVWLAFALPVAVEGYFWQKKPLGLVCITTGYRLAAYCLMATILIVIS